MLASGASRADAIALDAGNVRTRPPKREHAGRHLRGALPRARLHGTDELHGLGARRHGGDLGRHAEPGPEPGHPEPGGLGDAGQGEDQHDAARRRLRALSPDFTIDATLLSKISGKPVKLIYSRGTTWPPASTARPRWRSSRPRSMGPAHHAQVRRRLALDHGRLGLHEDPRERRRQLRDGRHRRPPLRHRQPAPRLRPQRAGAAGVVLALGGALAEHLLHRELHRRTGGRGQGRPVRVPPRAAGQTAALSGACSNSRRRRPAGAQRCPGRVPRHRGGAELRQLCGRSGRGVGREPTARRACTASSPRWTAA